MDESSSSDLESEFDLSDPEAEPQQLSQHDSQDYLHLLDKVMKKVVVVSQAMTTTMIAMIVRVLVQLEEQAAEGDGVVDEVVDGVEGVEGLAWGGKKAPQRKLAAHELSKEDLNVPKGHEFKPLRSIGPHLPSCIVSSQAELFKLYFDSDIVQKIRYATNEYEKITIQLCIDTFLR